MSDRGESLPFMGSELLLILGLHSLGWALHHRGLHCVVYFLVLNVSGSICIFFLSFHDMLVFISWFHLIIPEYGYCL